MKRHYPLPFGAEPAANGTRFRFWAPKAESVELALEGGPTLPMAKEPEGWFSLVTDAAGPGSRYRYKIGDAAYPDPASRFQPEGPSGPSEVVDPAAFAWTDTAWPGIPWESVVLYEVHTGTFSASGDFAGIASHLDQLIALGVNAIEIMPVGEFPGRWNWGYDGVLPYAVDDMYGGPAQLKKLVNACHAHGIAVVLDVVYNHFGPDGNFLSAYAPQYFTEKHHTPWGAAINFDDQAARHVRDYFIQNALYWLEEYHLDGLRLDAVHQIKDESEPNILVEVGHRIRRDITDRPIHLILENDNNAASLLGHGGGGLGPHTAQWDDDFHHALYVMLTGATGGYYTDYDRDPARHLGRALAEGFAFQGEKSAYRQGAPRGEASAGLSPTAFVTFLQNHDQVGNHAYGWRLGKFAKPEAIRAGAAILLLSPHIPMIWQGEEWNSDQPFPFFCDFQGDLIEAVRNGRMEEFGSFPEFQTEEARALIPDPFDEATIRGAILDWSLRTSTHHASFLAHYTELIRIRRAEVVPLLCNVPQRSGSYDVINPSTLVVHWRLGSGAIMQMALHLSPNAEEVALPPPFARLIYSTPQGHDQGVPPWFVSVSVEL